MSYKPKFLFGDIVVVDGDDIGVIVKTWERDIKRGVVRRGYRYEVYVRSYNAVYDYEEDEVERYRVRHKHLNEEELEYQKT